MKMQFKAICLAVLASVGAFGANVSHAGTVGIHTPLGTCSVPIGDPSAAITAAGHTSVIVPTLNAASLASLDGLVYNACASFPDNPDVDAAVAGGMALFANVHLSGSTVNATLSFPGDPPVTVTYNCSPATRDSNLAPGSPIATGSAGTLTDTSLDGAQYCSSSGYVSSLPAGFIPLLTSDGHDTVFSYTHGDGRVVVGLTSLMFGLPGGTIAGHYVGEEVFYANVVEWMLGSAEPVVTCASEGYTGTKLEWCKNICERGYTGGTLAMWIRRWTDRYRTLPYCALNDK